MGVLAYPRIHFKGRCLLNPATANNDDVIDNIDSVNVDLLPEMAALGDKAAHSLLLRPYAAVSPINQKLFTYLRTGWNYFGDASVRFVGAGVTSVVDSSGRPSTDDPIIGAVLHLLGAERTRPVICDVDPSGVAASQLFIGGLSLGDAELGLIADHDTRAYNRWIVWRNAQIFQGEQNYVGAGVTWQFAMAKVDLTFNGTSDSSALADLEGAADANLGILVQFCIYLPKPMIDDATLLALFQAGFDPCNPAEAFMVGTIGVWEEGDLRTVPDGRLLLPPPGAEDPLSNLLPFPLGPATARVQTDFSVVSLNLMSTFPEANYDRPPTQKANVGPVRLGLIKPGSDQPVPISQPFPYDYASYEQSGGIVDVVYDPASATDDELSDGSLVLLDDNFTQTSPGAAGMPASIQWKAILTEKYSTVTVDADDGAIYLDVDDQESISVFVREKGLPPSQKGKISLWEYQFVLIPGGFQQRASSALTLVEPGSALGHRIRYPRVVPFNAGQILPLTIDIEALAPGPVTLAFTLTGRPPEPGFPGWAASFAGVRVMPDDDYCDTPDDDLTWELMYRTVFRYYHRIFPAMSKIIRFDNQQAMEAAAQELVDRTNPALWHSTLYMPITRDLSTGKYELLCRWARKHPNPRPRPRPPRSAGPTGP